jgi:hypothetical protein
MVGCVAPTQGVTEPSGSRALARPVDLIDSRPPTAGRGVMPVEPGRGVRDAAMALPAVPTPESPAEAGLLMGEAMGALQRGQRRPAVVRLQALLRSDFLSDQGRANLYWLLADAADGVDDDVRRDALGGYLVAASALNPEPAVRDRMGRARVQLLAEHVQSNAAGQSPDHALDVDSHREADVVVAALACGHRGQGRYVERNGSDGGQVAADGLSMRRLLCTETGDERVLWFRLPDADGASSPARR